MRKLIALVMALLLSFGTSSAAWASVGEPFGVGYENPTALARAVRVSARTDPNGDRPVDPRKCLRNGYSCASAKQYVEGFKLADPEGARDLTVANLPEYLERLVPGTPEGEFWMACLQKNSMTAVWNCLARSLHRGERAWQNPVTGKFVLAGDCSNPIGEKVVPPPECIEQDVFLERGDEHHIGMLGPDALPASTCTAILKAGETEWSNLLLDECPRVGCDYSGPSRDLRLQVQPGINVSYRAEQTGWHKLRLPVYMLTSRNVLINCVIRPDGTQSMGMIIAGRHYHRGVAYLGYSNRDLTVPRGAFLHTWVFASGRLKMH